MTITLGIDPQVKLPAISRFIDGDFNGVVRIPIHLIGELLAKTKAEYPGCRIFACIEIPYMAEYPTHSNARTDIDTDEIFGESNRHKKRNPEVFGRQWESVGRIKQQLEDYCIKVFETRPSEWYMSIIPGAMSFHKTADRKKNSIAFLKEMTGIKTKDHNLADAYAIGQKCISELQIYERNKRIEAQKAEK